MYDLQESQTETISSDNSASETEEENVQQKLEHKRNYIPSNASKTVIKDVLLLPADTPKDNNDQFIMPKLNKEVLRANGSCRSVTIDTLDSDEDIRQKIYSTFDLEEFPFIYLKVSS